ncbi:glutathione S-transferase family protein [Ottowia sp. VDI28]|uniref:glutathione S-transferase family protein n=1 Tax=Ottowia sp. VDI28 TaxID=3133968 RepID=UPI003C2D7C85
MFVLYDNFASVAAQKVRLTLAEKGMQWQSVEINLRNGEVMRPDYLELNPRGVVPTLVHDGQVITESNVIIEYLEEWAPQPALRPEGALARARMRGWMRRMDDDIHRATGNISMAIYIRHAHLKKSQAERDAYFAAMPDAERAVRQQAAIALGLDAPAFAPSLRAFSVLVDEIDRAVAKQDWLCGDGFSLADIAAAPYILRLDMLAMDTLWSRGRRPAMARWWARVQARSCWSRVMHDAFPSAVREQMRQRGEEARARVADALGLK